jgi:hypothetical protein
VGPSRWRVLTARCQEHIGHVAVSGEPFQNRSLARIPSGRIPRALGCVSGPTGPRSGTQLAVLVLRSSDHRSRFLQHAGGADRQPLGGLLPDQELGELIAVAVLGTVMALGLFGPDLSPWLTALPAAGALLVISAVLLVPRLGVGDPASGDAGRIRKGLRQVRKALVGGTREAVQIVRSRNLLVIAGSLGYWAWGNAALWATFHAFGFSPPIAVILLGYLIGQLGGAAAATGRPRRNRRGPDRHADRVRHPGGGDRRRGARLPPTPLWLPLLLGAVAFASLRRGLNKPDRPELCVVPPAT